MAWLHATPEGSKKSRLKSYKDHDEDSPYLKLPDITGAEYIISLLHEAGLVSSTGMGVSSLTWTEISNWLSTTELSLTLWEKLTIKNLSEAYANEYGLASDKERPRPYMHVEEVEEIDRVAVGTKVLSVMRSFKKSNRGK